MQRNDKSDGGHTSTVTYSGSAFRQICQIRRCRKTESTASTKSKAQMNDVAISITINKERGLFRLR